jgi:hypothetical protein
MDPYSLARATDDAAGAAVRAGVAVRTLSTADEFAEARAIWDAVWPTVPGATEVTQNFVRAILHSGGYVAGPSTAHAWSEPAWRLSGVRGEGMAGTPTCGRTCWPRCPDSPTAVPALR